MRNNKLLTQWALGQFTVNGWLHIPSSWSAEVMAHQGYDSLTVDLQHGLMDYQIAVPMLQAISTTDVIPLARVPWNDAGIIMKLLDAGAYGIICPMINTGVECEKFVQACRYHPEGYRSLGPTRARIYGGGDYARFANEQIATIAMVESAEALENIDDIAGTPGLNAVYIGPGDLSLTMNLTKRVDNDEAVFLAALDKIITACKKFEIFAGIHTNDPEYARQMIASGFSFVTVMTDTTLLGTMAKQTIGAVRKGGQLSVEIPANPY